MEIHFTARKFRARKEVKDHAATLVRRLDKYYDGIVRSDVILSFEGFPQSQKTAEINLHVHGTILTARETSEEFTKSLELAMDKIERQLSKYKTKLRSKNKKRLRRVKEDKVASTIGEE